ncbi:MAG: hypothetical protein AAFO04_27620 [Cyanobacteria bacterium J06592_8]
MATSSIHIRPKNYIDETLLTRNDPQKLSFKYRGYPYQPRQYLAINTTIYQFKCGGVYCQVLHSNFISNLSGCQ